MKCRGKHDTTWNIPLSITFSPLHFMLYRGKAIIFGTVWSRLYHPAISVSLLLRFFGPKSTILVWIFYHRHLLPYWKIYFTCFCYGFIHDIFCDAMILVPLMILKFMQFLSMIFVPVMFLMYATFCERCDFFLLWFVCQFV